MVAVERDERNAKIFFRPGETESMNYRTPTRSGLIDGTPYKYTIDSQGRADYGQVGEWTVRSRFDEMEDTETWYLVHDDARLLVMPAPVGKPSRFCVIGHDYPGRHAMARVDTEQPVTAQGDDCFSSARLLSELLSASTIRTRRYEWPEDLPVDAVGDASHFADAVLLYAFMKKTRFE
ncbi:hypothetical protein L286_23575 [Sphingobium sp. HDIP04]|nr:hypothetical protein L286_23575 [Sphingobium sp. HDIP04]